jgi:hypothetical protein
MFPSLRPYRAMSTGLVVKVAKAIRTEDIMRESAAHRLYVKSLLLKKKQPGA